MSTEQPSQVQQHIIREVREFLTHDKKKKIVRFGGGIGSRNNSNPSTPTNPFNPNHFNFVNNTATSTISTTNSGSGASSIQQQQPQIQNSFQNIFNSTYDFSYFDGLSIKKICAGAVHYLVLTDKNELYSLGKNSMGQLGTADIPLFGESRIPCQIKWSKLFDDEKIVDISAKGWHSMILTNYGRTLVFGSNRYGQLGINSNQEYAPTPIPTCFKYTNEFGQVIVTNGAPYMKRVKLISAGVNHSLIATEDGYIYSCGWSEKGQTALGADNVIVFTEIPNTRGLSIYSVTAISCGGEHSMVLTEDNRLFIFGKYKKKNYNAPIQIQLETTPISYTFAEFLFSKKKVQPQPIIVQISSGDFFGLILTSDGRIWSFGDNDKGQCCQPSKYNHVEKPKLIPYFTPEMKITQVVSGSSHAFAISSTGVVYGFGRGEGERLALFDGEKNHHEPERIVCLDGFGTKRIAASGMFTVVSNSDGGEYWECTWDERSKYLTSFYSKLKQFSNQHSSTYSDIEFNFSS